MIPLGELCKVVAGGTPKRSNSTFYKGDIPWVKISDMLQGVICDTEEHISEDAIQGSTAKLLPAGTLLLSIFATVGRTAVLAVPATTNQAIVGLVLSSEDISVSYLRHFLDSACSHLKSLGRGVAQNNINGSILKALEIPFPFKNGKPDLTEQKRIAAILDKADGIRRKRREALQLADDFLRSCFLDMFGDPVTSGWVSDTVEGIANKEKGSIRTGPFGSQLLHSEFVDKGIRVLGIDNAVKNEFRIKQDRFISEEKYESLKRYTVHPNDVIITIMGTCGRCAIVPEEIEPAINTKHLCCITLNRKKCLPEYLHAYFLTHPLAKKYLKDRSKGAIMDGLNMGIIKALPVAMPPIQLQQHFVKICKVVNEKKRKLEIASTTCNDLFASLQQRAFKGEL